MDNTDKIILDVLRKNSRATLKKMSKASGLPITTTFEHLRKLEQSCILKYACLPHFANFGFSLRVMFFVTGNVLEVIEETARWACADNIFVSIGTVIIDCVVRSPSEIAWLEKELSPFGTVQTIQVLQTIKKEEKLAANTL